MDRHWLLTWTTYGTWLPGDNRGSVYDSNNLIGTPYSPSAPALQRTARTVMLGQRTFLAQRHAKLLLAQFHRTADHRGWQLLAAAVMRNHVHVVLGVPGDPEPDTLLRDLKSYGSRALGQSPSARWWTRSGSRRKLPNERAIVAAIRYVNNQHGALAVWVHDGFRERDRPRER